MRDRFGSHEIVRSIGRASPGEARRIVNRLWSQTELVFMRVRTEPLTRDEIAKVGAVAIDGFRDNVELAIAGVVPDVPLPPLEEPANEADRLRGLAALYDILLDRNDVVDREGTVRALARNVCGIERDHRRMNLLGGFERLSVEVDFDRMVVGPHDCPTTKVVTHRSR